MVTKVSYAICHSLTKDLNYDEDKIEIIIYAIETAIITAGNILMILIVACFLNTVLPTFIAAVFGGLLRKLSGGAHFNTPLKCLAFGTVVYNLIGLAVKLLDEIPMNFYVYIVMLILWLLIVAVLAPVDSKEKPIHSLKLRRALKISSVLFVICSSTLVLHFGNSLLTMSYFMGVGYQAITLLPIFNERGGERL